eukprot:3394543-Pleurochrysis_carterae.AAC.1
MPAGHCIVAWDLNPVNCHAFPAPHIASHDQIKGAIPNLVGLTIPTNMHAAIFASMKMRANFASGVCLDMDRVG